MTDSGYRRRPDPPQSPLHPQVGGERHAELRKSSCAPSLERTWTEGSPHVPARAVLTRRAGAEATRQVGGLALPVAVVA
jgi:hypothetical protein